MIASLAAGGVLIGLDGAEPAWLPGVEAVALANGLLFAAAMRVVRWRSSSDAGGLARAAGCAAAGVLVPISTLLAPWSMAQDPNAVATIAQALLVVVAFPLLDQTCGDALCGVRLAKLATAGAVLVAAVSILAHGPGGPLLLGVVVVVGWLVLADRARDDGWFGVAMVLLAIGATIRVVGYVAGERFAMFTLGVNLAAAVLLAVAAGVQVDRQRRQEQADARSCVLAPADDDLVGTVQAQARRLHDARSLTAGAIGAAQLLTDSGSDSGSGDAALPRLLLAELTRLAAVLDGTDEPVTEFALDEALHSVVSTHALARPDLESDLPAIRAVGRPLATATALDNLLRNARVHAPDAALRVAARVDAHGVHVTVDDDGPGLPAAARSRMLGFGTRGPRPTRPGSGIGLHSVATSMRAQGGDVHLDDSPLGGARVVLTLPTAVRTRHVGQHG